MKKCVARVVDGVVDLLLRGKRYLRDLKFFTCDAALRSVDRAVADFGTKIFDECCAFMGAVHRARTGKRNVNRSPIQVGCVLEESKLNLTVKHWVGLKSTLPITSALQKETLKLSGRSSFTPVAKGRRLESSTPVRLDEDSTQPCRNSSCR